MKEIRLRLSVLERDDLVAAQIDDRWNCESKISIPQGAEDDEHYRRDITDAAWERIGRMLASQFREMLENVQTTYAETMRAAGWVSGAAWRHKNTDAVVHDTTVRKIFDGGWVPHDNGVHWTRGGEKRMGWVVVKHYEGEDQGL